MGSKLEFNIQANCHSSVREEKVYSDRLGLKKCISDELFLRKPLEDILHPKEKDMESRKGEFNRGERQKNFRKE